MVNSVYVSSYSLEKKIEKNMKTTITENETIERYLLDLRIQGHNKSA